MKRRFIGHDHITLNTTIYHVTKQQIDNRKFIHEPTTIVLLHKPVNYRASRESRKKKKQTLSRRQIKDHR